MSAREQVRDRVGIKHLLAPSRGCSWRIIQFGTLGARVGCDKNSVLRDGPPERSRERAHDPQCIEQTRRYLIDARRLLAEKPTPQAYYEAMLALYPDRLNRGPLWYSGVGLPSAEAIPPVCPAVQ